MTYDLAIIGGGPAGVAAGVYAARKKLRTVFITPDFNSQSSVSDDIQNWIGTKNISGLDLVKSLREHLLAYAADVVDVKEGEKVVGISGDAKSGFVVKTSDMNGAGEKTYSAKTVLITTGSTRRRLEIPGADQFEHKGLTYCASCDGPLFADRDVVVIGGGNAGFETAAQLLAYASSVTLLHHGPQFKADAVTVEKVLQNPKMKALKNADPVRVLGEKFVNGIVYKDNDPESPTNGQEITLPVGGVFVEIGLIPTTSFAKNILPLNQIGQIPVDPRTQMTTVPGIWAAGDCTDGLYHQNNIAAGDAVKALEDIYLFLRA